MRKNRILKTIPFAFFAAVLSACGGWDEVYLDRGDQQGHSGNLHQAIAAFQLSTEEAYPDCPMNSSQAILLNVPLNAAMEKGNTRCLRYTAAPADEERTHLFTLSNISGDTDLYLSTRECNRTYKEADTRYCAWPNRSLNASGDDKIALVPGSFVIIGLVGWRSGEFNMTVTIP